MQNSKSSVLKTTSRNNKNHSQSSARCPICFVTTLCLSSDLTKEGLIRLNSVIQKSKVVNKHAILYENNDDFDSLYIVNSGMFKSVRYTEEGKEKIINFHLPGELMGFDGIHTEHYQSSLKAVTMSSHNKILYADLLGIFPQAPQVNSNLIKMMSREIYSCKKNHVDLNSKAKLAQFIVNLSDRFGSRGYSGKNFQLPISQRDIANYLGMAEETLSRNFKKLQTSKIVEYKHHMLTIVEMQALIKIAES